MKVRPTPHGTPQLRMIRIDAGTHHGNENAPARAVRPHGPTRIEHPLRPRHRGHGLHPGISAVARAGRRLGDGTRRHHHPAYQRDSTHRGNPSHTVIVSGPAPPPAPLTARGHLDTSDIRAYKSGMSKDRKS